MLLYLMQLMLTRFVPGAPDSHKLMWLFKQTHVRSSQREDVARCHLSVSFMNWRSSWSSFLMNSEEYLPHVHSRVRGSETYRQEKTQRKYFMRINKGFFLFQFPFTYTCGLSFSAHYFGPYRKQKWRNVNQMPAWWHTQGNVPVTHTKKSQFCPLFIFFFFQFCSSSEVK